MNSVFRLLIIKSVILILILMWAFEVQRTTSPEFEAEIQHLVKYIEEQREDPFVAEVKAGEYCPSVRLIGDGMVKEYTNLIAAGRLNKDQLRNACKEAGRLKKFK